MELYEYIRKFSEIKDTATREELEALAEECAENGSGVLFTHLAASAPFNTPEELDRKWEYCMRAEALGEDVSLAKKLVEDMRYQHQLEEKMANAPTADDIAKTLMEAQQIMMEIQKEKQEGSEE